jgi:leader peptidase (prepilin peptidase) / N-methyltransferase
MTPLVIGLALGGAAWGLVCDRISARWPAHEDGSTRAIDWRTAAVVLVAAVAFGALGARMTEPRDVALFGAWFAALTLLLATDLDQRLLPDVVTLPLIPIAAVAMLVGLNPLVRGVEGLAVVAAIAVPAVLYALSIPFGSGAFGLGDVKLLVSTGLILGLERTIVGIAGGAILGGIVILAMLVARRVTLRDFVPYGPFLIIGAMWGALLAT